MRRALVLVVLAVLAAACAASDPSTVDVPGGATTTAPLPAAGAAPPTSAASGPPRTIVVGGTEAVPDAGAPDDAPATTVAAAPVVSGGPGAGAALFLRPSPASRLVVQVRSEPGHEPRRATLDRVAAVLRSVSGKSVTVVGGDAVPADADGRWTSAEIRAVGDADRPEPRAGTAVIRLLFLGGAAADGEDTVGVAVVADLAAVFVDKVAGPAYEEAVTVHELGHLLGLVDLVLDTGREDPEHPGHSTNRRSVMYWAVESTILQDLLAGGPPREFDEADLADLATIRRG